MGKQNHRHGASHWQTLSHNVVWVHLAMNGFKLTTLVVIGNDCTCSRKSNYHTTTTTAAPFYNWWLVNYYMYLMTDCFPIETDYLFLTYMYLKSEWLLFNAKWAIFSHIMSRTSNILMSWLGYPFCTSSPKQQFSGRHFAHSDTLSRFRVNQSLLLLLNAACLA